MKVVSFAERRFQPSTPFIDLLAVHQLLLFNGYGQDETLIFIIGASTHLSNHLSLPTKLFCAFYRVYGNLCLYSAILTYLSDFYWVVNRNGVN